MLLNDACKCRDYKRNFISNKILVIPPEWSSKECISIDKCLVNEIFELWSKGIITLGSCCGHKENLPFINVDESQYDRMIELGYTLLTNPHVDNGKIRKDTWYPKSIKIEPNMVENYINHYYKNRLLAKK